MKFFYKFSKVGEAENNSSYSKIENYLKKEKVISEMKKEIKALLDVYNFIEAIKEMSMPLALIDRL